MINFKDKFRHQASQRGFSLMEVLIGIAIFAIGMLALASFQGALTRSTAEAKVRTTAINIAEQIIEGQRGFAALATGGAFSFEDIADVLIGAPLHYVHFYDGTTTRYEVGELVPTDVEGVTYTVTQDVTDWYYDLATDAFTETEPTGAIAPDYKTVLVEVAWNDDREYVINEGTQTSDNLGGGFVEVSATISSISIVTAAQVAEQDDDDIIAPPIGYTPGERPEIVALSVGDGRFKESLTPEPDVVRNDDLVKTTFEVITYATSNNAGEFLRREEFVTLPCECTFAGTGDALRPVIWAGDQYAGGHLVNKPYGVSANNQQPAQLCETCCRDHHDGPSGQAGDNHDLYSNVVGPFKKDGEYVGTARASDHNHYNEVGSAVTSGDYLEVCRMVRVDGFLKVGQDFRREDQYVFPADFLDLIDPGDTEIDAYSSYVTNAVLAYDDIVDLDDYPPSPPCIGIPQPPLDGDPTCVAVPNMQNTYPVPRGSNELPSWTTLQTDTLDEQQLRSRGIFIDYISYDLRKFIDSCISGGELVNDCCIRNGAVVNQCTSADLYMDKAAGSANILEILPFFEVQMTKLENWRHGPPKITLTNQPIADKNSHSRGKATQIVIGRGRNETITLGSTETEADSHRGNIGFTNTLPIDPVFEVKGGILKLHSLDTSGGGIGVGDSSRVVLSGRFQAFVDGDPIISVRGDIDGDATCNRTPAGYYCFYPLDTTIPILTLIVDGYEDTHTLIGSGDVHETRYACSTELIRIDSNTQVGNTNATFSLRDIDGVNLPTGTAYDITIQRDPCVG